MLLLLLGFLFFPNLWELANIVHTFYNNSHMYMYVWVCMCVYVCMYIYVYIYICICVYIYVYILRIMVAKVGPLAVWLIWCRQNIWAVLGNYDHVPALRTVKILEISILGLLFLLIWFLSLSRWLMCPV